MTSRLFDHHRADDFDWEKIESAVDPGEVATQIVGGVLSFLLALVFAGTAKPQTAYRRFLALVYIMRPDLLPKKSQGQLASELGVVKSEIARHVASIRDELEIGGRNLIPAAARLKIKAGQLAAREKMIPPPDRKKNQRKKYNWPLDRHLKTFERLEKNKGARREK